MAPAVREAAQRAPGVSVAISARRPIGDGEEAAQRVGRLSWSLLREEMAGLERVPSSVVTPLTPERERSPRVGVPGGKRSVGAPERQERTRDAPSGGAIRSVVLAIEGRGGSILLADRMRVGGIAKRLNVGCTHFGRKCSRRRAPTPERVVDDGFGRRRQDAFWKWFGLSEERPRPVVQRQPRIGAVPDGRRRHDVEDGKTLDTVGMVERHAIGDPPATIVPRDRIERLAVLDVVPTATVWDRKTLDTVGMVER